MSIDLHGIYAAVITPFDDEGKPSIDAFGRCLEHLAGRGCHGVLVAGTTGEGASLNVQERISLFRTAAQQQHNLRLLAGTGAASLEDAVDMTKAAYDAGCDATVIIPPFFYKTASDEGFFNYYQAILSRAVPSDGSVVLYHNPVTTVVGLSLELVGRLRDAFPEQIIGIKDSSQNWEHAKQLITHLAGFQVLVGDDRLLSKTLQTGGAGSLTLVANGFPDLALDVYDRYLSDKAVDEAQARLSQAHAQFDGLPRIPAIKALLKSAKIIDNESVRPPLSALSSEEEAILKERFLLNIEIPNAVRLSDLYDPDTPQ